MLERERQNRETVEFVNTEMYVPQNHLLRKIDAALDWVHVYDFVSELYSPKMGRPSIDPVVLFKMVLIQHLYGLPSLRRTAEEIEMNIAYKWFLGYLLNEQTPHFSTISYNFKHRFTQETVESVFLWILAEIERAGYLTPEAVFVDGTHIKANANMQKKLKQMVPKAARIYEEQLRAEVNADRESHGKKPFDDDDAKPEDKETTVSATDPDAGLFHKGEHRKCFAYEAHTVCDGHGYILDTVVTAGNVHDSVAFDAVYEKVTQHYPQIKVIAADSAYRTPWIAKRIIDDERIPSLPYKRPMTADYGYKWFEYVYDEYNDWIICPQYKELTYATTNREGYREYKSNPKVCSQCPTRLMCTHSKNCQKTVTRHIWSDYLEIAEDYRHTPEYKAIYERRKETIERCFADAKEKHAMRFSPYRGLAQVSNWVRLKFAAMNLKKFAKRRWNDPRFCLLFSFLTPILAALIKKKKAYLLLA